MALVRLDGFHEAGRPAVMQEEDPLSHSPQWSRPELISVRAALRDVVGETVAHVVDEEVRESVDRHVGLLRDVRHCTGIDGRGVAKRAADIGEHLRTRLGLRRLRSRRRRR